jgi:hypothetical protein
MRNRGGYRSAKEAGGVEDRELVIHESPKLKSVVPLRNLPRRMQNCDQHREL